VLDIPSARRYAMMSQFRYLVIVLAIAIVAVGVVLITKERQEVPAKLSPSAEDNALDQVLGQGKPVLADFGRGTCIPCKKMAPILEELAREYRGKAHILVLDLSEPVNKQLARRYRVTAIPTQVFFDSRGNLVDVHVGFMPKEEIVRKLEELGTG